jgi:hypothetical protein
MRRKENDMARYIDADELIRLLEIDAVCEGDYFSKRSAIRSVKAINPADVVPRSDVELYKRLNDALEDEISAAYDKLENAKTEVARKIFEEIEQKVKASITIHLEEINKEHIKDTPLYDRHSGIIFALQCMDDFIAELKKKYTERCPDCNHFVGCECFSGQTCDEYEEGKE